MSIITQSYSTKLDHSGTIKHLNHSTVSPSISLRLRGLAQASRLGDFSCNSPRRAPCFISPRRD